MQWTIRAATRWLAGDDGNATDGRPGLGGNGPSDRIPYDQAKAGHAAFYGVMVGAAGLV